jgi:hypothetical protein
MALPKFPVEGGRQCAAVRYRLKVSSSSAIGKECQRFSGAAWSISMFVRAEDFEALSGQTVRYDRKADSVAMNFCAHCHGWLWNNNPTLPGIKVTRAARSTWTGPSRSEISGRTASPPG